MSLISSTFFKPLQNSITILSPHPFKRISPLSMRTKVAFVRCKVAGDGELEAAFLLCLSKKLRSNTAMKAHPCTSDERLYLFRFLPTRIRPSHTIDHRMSCECSCRMYVPSPQESRGL